MEELSKYTRSWVLQGTLAGLPITGLSMGDRDVRGTPVLGYFEHGKMRR